MVKVIASLVSGLIFGLGLIVSGMVNPAKVLGFLDFAGDWDPSLAFVMGGAVLVAFVGFRLLREKPRPVFSERFQWPTATDIDGRLLSGAAIFGVGWGLGGFCPGPAITGIGLMRPGTIVFVIAMLIGMIAARMLARPGKSSSPQQA
ncbi:MAG: DUF6691 family protein [Hyphomicrobiales bacterium]